MEHLLAAERLNPEYYRAPYNRGLLLEELGRWEEAAEAYRRAVELEPRYLLARTALGEMLLLQRQIDSAATQFREVVDYEDRWEGRHHPLARARALRYLGYLQERRRLAEIGLEDCFETSASFRHAEIARLRGRASEALDALRRYFEEGGDCAEAFRALGTVLLESRELDGAEDAFLRAIRADERIPGARLGLARIAAVRGEGERAVEHLKGEVRLDPSSPEPYLELGLVAERLLNDPARAATWFRKFREVGGDPRVLDARRGAGRDAAIR